jgi:7-carboxy-7-deazaguanine synthase
MTKRYRIKEIFLTLQGEGAQAGRAAVFCRFTGCNLWTGAPEDRAAAACRFCDTDFNGTDGERGGEYDVAETVSQVLAAWGGRPGQPYVVCTGGEPLLQLDVPLIEAFRAAGFEIAIETNGTLPAPEGIDWICVSPKAGTRIVQRSGHELKVVVPQSHDWTELEAWDFTHRFVQPMDGAAREASTRLAIAHCLERPRWRLSLQTHKLLGIP